MFSFAAAVKYATLNSRHSFTGGYYTLMFVQIILTIWLLALIFLTNKFRREGRITQQRIFSIFLIIWSCLSIAYYDVWTYTSGALEQNGSHWYTYLPAVYFSICAGLGTYYLMMTFGKFRELQQKKLAEDNSKSNNKKNSSKKNNTANKKNSKKK